MDYTYITDELKVVSGSSIPEDVKSSSLAVIFLDFPNEVDPDTVKQVTRMVQHPSVKKARVMPDCHQGSGCCVGFTCELTTCVTPGIIGGDIGCGVSAHPIPKHFSKKKKAAHRLHNWIEEFVPMGSVLNDVPVATAEDLNDVFTKATEEAQHFAEAYFNKFGTRVAMPIYSSQWLQSRMPVWGITEAIFMGSLGTLGSGNHFIEVDEDTATGEWWLVVHSGSRALGQAIYRYWSARQRGRAAEVAARAHENDDDESIPFDSTAHLTPQDAEGYFSDMIFAQHYACKNRRLMLSSVLQNIQAEPTVDGSSFSADPLAGIADDEGGEDVEGEARLAEKERERHETSCYRELNVIESIHNYIDFADLVIRKGAIRANANQMCLIALNMRDGALICRGRGNSDWNCSAPHGCGRCVPRNRCKGGGGKKESELLMKKFKQEMGEVIATLCPEVLDERPSVYRSPHLIRRAMTPTVDVEKELKVIVSAKGAG